MSAAPLMRILQLARLNVAAGRHALEDGRVDEVVVTLRRSADIAASLESEPVPIIQLVRLALTRASADLLRSTLATVDLTGEQLKVLQSTLPGLNSRRSIQQALVVEATAYDGLFTGRGEFPDVAWPVPWMRQPILRAIARPYLLAEERLWLEEMERQILTLDSPRHTRAQPSPRPPLQAWDLIVREIVDPNLSSLIDRTDLAESRDQLMRVAIAVERYRIETGRAPGSLTDLLPAYLSSLTDPWTGREFHYETDGKTWRIRGDADKTAIHNARIDDPVLDWSKPPANE